MIEATTLIVAAVGSFSPGSPATEAARFTAETPFTASVAYTSTSAGARGTLYFMGAMNDDAITPPAGATDPVLGVRLFDSHNNDPAARAGFDLGLFDAGSSLHFAYLVTNGVSVAPTGSLFRTDVDTDPAHFAFVSAPVVDGDTTTYAVGIEDIRDPNRSDWDYNDVIFEVSITSVPTPGAGMLALTGLAISVRRRR